MAEIIIIIFVDFFRKTFCSLYLYVLGIGINIQLTVNTSNNYKWIHGWINACRNELIT